MLRLVEMAIRFLRIDADQESSSAGNELLVSKEIKVYELSLAQETLEEAFLRLIKTGANL